jgi:hypothetical protein
MRSNVSKFYNIKSLRELRSVQRENEAAKEAAKSRVCKKVMNIFSLEKLFDLKKI